MTRKQLVALAKRARIPRYSRMAKIQLIAALASARTSEVTELPANYGRTRLTLMEIEPYWVYAYWEVTPAHRRAVFHRRGTDEASGQWILRFFDITGVESRPEGGHDPFDVLVNLKAGSWYVNLWSGGKSYIADLGLRTARGRFVPLCRSNPIRVPSAGPSPESKPRWLKVEGIFEQVEEVSEPAPIDVPAQSQVEGRRDPPPEAPVASAPPAAAGATEMPGVGPACPPRSCLIPAPQEPLSAGSSFGLGINRSEQRQQPSLPARTPQRRDPVKS